MDNTQSEGKDFEKAPRAYEGRWSRFRRLFRDGVNAMSVVTEVFYLILTRAATIHISVKGPRSDQEWGIDPFCNPGVIKVTVEEHFYGDQEPMRCVKYWH
jgi:hypothetical protein